MTKKLTSSERIQRRSQQRREQEKREVRAAIIQAAGELFLEKGYEGFSLRQIAERIGYSPGTIYLYFKDKDDLLFTLAIEGFNEFGARLQAAQATSTDPLQQLRAMGLAYVDFGLAHPAHYQLMFMQRPEFMLKERDEDDAQPVDTFAILQATVEACMAAGKMRQDDPVAASDVVWSALHGVVSLAICMPQFDGNRVEKARHLAMTMIEDGLTV